MPVGLSSIYSSDNARSRFISVIPHEDKKIFNLKYTNETKKNLLKSDS